MRVRTKQRELGVEADGIWGPVTKAAYQRSLAGNADAQAHTNADLHQKTYLDAPNSIDAALADRDAGTDLYGRPVPPSGAIRRGDAYQPLTMAGLKLAEQAQGASPKKKSRFDAPGLFGVTPEDGDTYGFGAYSSGSGRKASVAQTWDMGGRNPQPKQADGELLNTVAQTMRDTLQGLEDE